MKMNYDRLQARLLSRRTGVKEGIFPPHLSATQVSLPPDTAIFQNRDAHNFDATSGRIDHSSVVDTRHLLAMMQAQHRRNQIRDAHNFESVVLGNYPGRTSAFVDCVRPN